MYGTDKFSTGYLGEDRVYRVIRAAGEQMFEEMNQQSLLEKLPSYGVIETAVADRMEVDKSRCVVLEHPKIPFVTHPGEWSPSMLRDAALFLLELSIRLDEHGLMLKDGHLLNVTSTVGGRFSWILVQSSRRRPISMKSGWKSIAAVHGCRSGLLPPSGSISRARC